MENSLLHLQFQPLYLLLLLLLIKQLSILDNELLCLVSNGSLPVLCRAIWIHLIRKVSVGFYKDVPLV